MNTRHTVTTDDIVAAWERSTDRPAPPFTIPEVRPWRGPRALVLIGVLLALVAGALAVGPLAGLRPVEPTLETGLASLANMEAVGFRLRFEVTHSEGTVGFTANGVAVPPRRALSAAGQSISPDADWPFGGVGNGALVLVDGRLFVRHGGGPWEELRVGPDGDPGLDVLSRLLDGPTLSRALHAAAASADSVSSSRIGCGDRTCARHDIRFNRRTMHALAVAITGRSIDEPPQNVSPLVAAVIVDPDGGLVTLEGGFTQDEGTLRIQLDLESLDEVPPIEAPIR
jgi:hypothetical protein